MDDSNRSSSPRWVRRIGVLMITSALAWIALTQTTTVLNSEDSKTTLVKDRSASSGINNRPWRVDETIKAIATNSLSKEQLIAAIANNTLSIERVPFVFPKPNRSDTVEVYNKVAYEQLRDVVRNKQYFSLCANGGSATAGGGLKDSTQRYYLHLVRYMNSTGVTRSDGSVKVIGRGHGNRHSLHSAMVLNSYVPAGTDVVIWEFAINDYGYNLDYRTGVLEARNSLIYWLQQVSKIKPKPPLVILAYLWKSPFQFVDNKVDNPTFVAHQRLATEYDFVVGHVNLASYMDELGWDYEQTKLAFLADKHHPNALGHALLAYLILDFLVDDTRVQQEQHQPEDVKASSAPRATVTPFQWACGTDTEDKLFLHRRVVPTINATPSPLAAFTSELPKNAVLSPDVLTIVESSSASNANNTVILGKALLTREDRLASATLPCCSNVGVGRQTMDFALLYEGRSHPIEGMQALQLGLYQYQGPIRVYLDDHSEPTAGRMIGVGEWPCLWTFQDVYLALHWFALEKERTASRIGICSVDQCCTAGNTSSCSNILSLVVF